jgi:hypothetical protein
MDKTNHTRRVTLLATALLALGAWPLAANADHLQGSSPGLVFDHRGGNEWWVEVAVGGPDAARVTKVEASASGGPWVALEKKSWGNWAGSFHITPGHDVHFRATLPEGLMGSCWFVHPQGWEDCTLYDTMAARFTVSGNAGQVRVTATGSQPVTSIVSFAGVDSGFFEGPALYQHTDGAWYADGASEVPPGAILMFRAHGTASDANAMSDCYRWPEAVAVPCPVMIAGWMEDIVQFPDGHTIGAENHYHAVTTKLEVRFDGGTFQAMAPPPPDGPGWYTYSGAPTSGKHIAEFRLTTPAGLHCDEVGYWYPPEWPPNVGSGGGVVFTEMKGSTSWVQVNTYSDFPVVAVGVQVNGGPWQALQHQPYCDWAAPINVPAGASVRFRAFGPDLTQYFSVPTAWPPGGGGGAFDAVFTGVRGNEWWVQANVATSGGTLSKVDVRVNDGPWQPLAKQSWGGWAASYHITQGSIVQLRATSTTGATDLSSCRQWIPPPNTDAQIVPCNDLPPPPPPGFDATFSGVKGNEWWVQANVAANQPLAGVDARVNCGTWVPLTLQSWGGWAKSFHVPNGAKVDFRARSTGGASDLSGGYIWPNATPTSAC